MSVTAIFHQVAAPKNLRMIQGWVHFSLASYGTGELLFHFRDVNPKGPMVF